MGKGAAIVASGSWRLRSTSLFFLLAGLTAAGGQAALAQESATGCAPAIARVVSLQGAVDVQRAGTGAWLSVKRLDTSICAGDRLRTAPLSRAALFVQPETIVRVDENTTIALHQTTDEILIEFHTDEVAQTARDAQSCGAGYFITRFPKKFKVTTPHLNAAVEGTEFMVESSCDATELTVLEGQVLSEVAMTREQRSLTAGQRLSSGQSGTPAFSTLIEPEDAVQWVLQYPTLSDAGAEPVVSPAGRAEEMLRLGRVDEALREIDAALKANSADADALALRAIIQIAKNDGQAAVNSATQATAADPTNHRAWLALSYAQQASFELDDALESSTQARALQPDSSLIHARVAELLLAFGRARGAEESARAAITANPSESRAHSVLGFVYLAQVRTQNARAAFEAAIERNSFAALPRLGLGLALVRDGRLTAGREQLEIAVALDPGNSLLRSYVGKAYYEENTANRDELAATQFALARDLDPRDPTPRLYEAIRLQTANRPVEALREIRQSVALNDNRAVYRSKLKLDEDLAVRSASQGRIYRDLGFEALAVLDGWKSVNSDPGDFSGHRVLADTYSGLPRHELARVNELFTSQVLQQRNLTPIPPQLGDTNLFILDTAGPTDIAFNEFNPLFNSDGRAVHASATVGGNDTWGEDVAFALMQDRWSFSLGQFHFETDGFRPNNDVEQDTYNAFAQFHHSERTSLLTELRITRREQGDLRLLFDPSSFDPTRRQQEDAESIRIGAHHVFNPRSELLASFVYQNLDFGDSIPTFFERSGDVESYTVELQHIFSGDHWRMLSGVRQSRRDLSEQQVIFGETTPSAFEFDSTSAYAYTHWNAADSLTVSIGATADFLEGRAVDKDQVNPKFGLMWEPSSNTTLRLAAVRTVLPDTFSRQDVPPRLEPTQVAGFNQVFSGAQGTSDWLYGLAVDHQISADTFIGAEISHRDIDIPFLSPGPPDVILERDAREQSARAYLYWSPISVLAVNVGYRYDKEEYEDFAALVKNVFELTTHRVPIGIGYFHSSGFSVNGMATFVDQQGDFLEFVPVPPFVQAVADGDQFWVLDASIRYRLPRRKGIIAMGVENLLDEDFRFQDIDPENPDIIPERLVSLKFTLAF